MIFFFHIMHSSNHSNTKTKVNIIAAFRTRTIELREISCFLSKKKKKKKRAPESRSSFFFKSKISFHLFPHINTLANLIVKAMGIHMYVSDHNHARTTFWTPLISDRLHRYCTCTVVNKVLYMYYHGQQAILFF